MKIVFLYLLAFTTTFTAGHAAASPLSTTEIEEIVLTDVLPLSLGNDGADCTVESLQVKTIFSRFDFLYLFVKASREPSQPGCAPAQMDCRVWINFRNLNNLTDRETKFSCI